MVTARTWGFRVAQMLRYKAYLSSPGCVWEPLGLYPGMRGALQGAGEPGWLHEDMCLNPWTPSLAPPLCLESTNVFVSLGEALNRCKHHAQEILIFSAYFVYI